MITVLAHFNNGSSEDGSVEGKIFVNLVKDLSHSTYTGELFGLLYYEDEPTVDLLPCAKTELKISGEDLMFHFESTEELKSFVEESAETSYNFLACLKVLVEDKDLINKLKKKMK